MNVECSYCGGEAELVDGTVVYPHRHDLAGRKFWRCEPCGAYVGTHKDSPVHAPLGRLANAELRALKRQVHAAFDPIWRNGIKSRSGAYAWLADGLSIAGAACHIGMFSEQRCREALRFLWSMRA